MGLAQRSGSIAFLLLVLLSIAAVECSDDPCEGLGAEMCPERGGFEIGRGIDAQVNPRSRTDKIHSQGERESEVDRLIRSQNAQLGRMEHLIKHLEDSVQALRDVASMKTDPSYSRQTDSSESSKVSSSGGDGSTPSQTGPVEEQVKPDQSATKPQKPVKSPKSRVVARYKPAWSDYFQFLSAVRVDAPLSCLHILPHEGDDGLSKYVAVGDEAGHLYIFSSLGDLMVDHASLCTAPVTAMISVILRRNETLLVTGHSNGAVLAHRLWEVVHRGASAAEDWTSLSIEYGHSFMFGEGLQGSPVVNLEMYRVGRMRYLLVSDEAGKIQVFRDNGTLYGTAESPSRPLAFLRTSSTQRLLFLTASGAASLDLRSMTVRSSPCEGLNNSSLVAYAFDAAGRSKAYGVTQDGNLIYVALSGDTLHFDCHAKAKRKLDVEGPVKLHGLKGYILLATPRDVAVFNTTLQTAFGYSSNIVRVGGPRLLFTASMDEISQTFLSTPVAPCKPLMVCDRDKLVVLGFGEGYVGIFKSNLPTHRSHEIGAKFWGGPAFVSLMVVVLAWYFFSRKKDHHPVEEATSSGFPGGNVAVSAPSASAAASTVDNSPGALRKYDQMRSGLGDKRDDSRRFGSPSRVYGAGGASGAGYGVGHLNYRNTAVEHTPY